VSDIKIGLSPARLPVAPAYIAFLMLAIGAICFVDNRLFAGITLHLGLSLPVSNLFIGLALVPAMLALASLRRWSDKMIRMVMYLSLALYLPAVIGVSQLDLFKVAGFSFNFDALSGSLPPAIIAVFGIMLACGGLLLRSFSYTKAARANFLKRGAQPGEVDLALYRHTLLETKIIGTAAAVVVVIIIGVTVLEPAVLWVLQSAKFLYVPAGLGAALVLGMVILVYLRSIKR
jgi:hypothetical protein